MILNLFQCKRCLEPIPLPLETLQRTFAYQVHQSMDIYPLAIACSHCMTVESYKEADLKDFGEASNPTPAWDVPEPWLRCGEETCELLQPLFVDLTPATDGETKRAILRLLKWGDVVCLRGHTVPKPKW
jgi:hypothetical protein